MKPFISYIIICVVGIAILIRCLPRGTKKRKRFEIFAEIGIGLFISVIVLGLTSFDNFMLKKALGVMYVMVKGWYCLSAVYIHNFFCNWYISNNIFIFIPKAHW